MRLISLSDRTRFRWPLPSLTPCLALPLVRPGSATSLGAFSSEEQVRSPRSLGLPTSETASETQQGSLRAEAGLPVKLLPPTLLPGQAWPGLWEEQGRPQHSHWEVGGREGPPPHGRHREGGGLHLLAFSPSALGSRASFLSERRGHALRSLSCQLLRGFIHVSV